MLTLKNNSSGTSGKKVSVLVCRRRVINPLPVFNDERLYTPEEVAVYLKVSVSYLKDLRWRHKPPLYVKLSDRPKAQVRYVGRDLSHYLAETPKARQRIINATLTEREVKNVKE